MFHLLCFVMSLILFQLLTVVGLVASVAGLWLYVGPWAGISWLAFVVFIFGYSFLAPLGERPV